jgi:hypothetical protein|tara:strand:+ start:340 stop:792 length:453 start_codon:yes stop_codon:yes gene_type:complete
MEELNNPESEIFTITLEKQNQFITERLKNIKNKYLDDDFIVHPQKKENIVRHLNNGIAANTIQTFFNYKTDTCIFCKGIKGENGIRQIERAHCNNYSRSDILHLAVSEISEKLYNGECVTVGEILKKFIEKHDCCPIYMLCNKCHNKYDN